MKEYACPVCKATIEVKGNNVHDHYVGELSNKFEKEGYRIIQEGKMPERVKGLDVPLCEQLMKAIYEGEMPKRIKEWYEPDIFVLKDLRLAKVVEIIDKEGYRVTCVKAEKIKKYYNPPEIIIFQPVRFLDRYWLPENLSHYERVLGHKPTSCIEIQEYFTKIWRKKGLKVIFWNETNI